MSENEERAHLHNPSYYWGRRAEKAEDRVKQLEAENACLRAHVAHRPKNSLQTIAEWWRMSRDRQMRQNY